jgi:hypothetical protein
MQKNIDDIKQNLDEISQIIAKTVPGYAKVPVTAFS